MLAPSLLKHLTAVIPKPVQADADVDVIPPIVLEYSKSRQIAINSQAVSFDGVSAQIANRLRFDKRKLVFFKIDDECDYGEVVRLMDTVRGAGARTLGIVTTR